MIFKYKLPKFSISFILMSTLFCGLVLTALLVRSGYDRDSEAYKSRLLLLEHTWSLNFSAHEKFFTYLENEFTLYFQNPQNKTQPLKKFQIFSRPLLDLCDKTLHQSVCLFLDPQGTAIDGSYLDAIGANYSSRSYYQEALQGKIGDLIAFGMVTKVPGIHRAKAIYNSKKEIQGILVFKTNLLWVSPLNENEMELLTDRNGIVIAANQNGFVQRSVGPMEASLQKKLIQEKIYHEISKPILTKDSGFFRQGFFPAKIFSLPIKKNPNLQFVILGPLRHATFSFFIGLLLTGFLIFAVYLIGKWNFSLQKYRERMIVSDRMASIGNLASGLAHEINNPLVLLKYNVSLFREIPNHLLQGKLEQALIKQDEAIDRIADIVRGLQEYTRLSSDASGPTDVHEVIHTALVLIRKVYAKEQIFITEKLEATQPWIDGNTAKLVQAIVSLVAFFKEIRPNEDTPRLISIETKNEGAKLLLLLKEKDTVLEALEIERIFDPFFPIRSLGRHSLGPYVAYSLVHQMDGETKAFVEENKHLTFTLEFPFIPY